MTLAILNIEGKKTKEIETKLFEEPIREDIIRKVVEAEKTKHPYSPKLYAGIRSASGKIKHKRHSWKSDRGKGLSRIPRKVFMRRGTNFSWEGAVIPSTKGGRRAHPPKGIYRKRKINKKEMKKALLSALSYVSNNKELEKKYSSLEKIDKKLPLIIESEVLKLKTKEFLESLKKIFDEKLYSIAIQNKNVRAGKGKMRGRKYRKNAGLLFIIGNKEDKKINGIEIIKVKELTVSDLAGNGARLTLFSENAVKELEKIFENNKDKEIENA